MPQIDVSEKEYELIVNLRKRSESIIYGNIILELRVHQSKVAGAEIREERVKLC